MQSKFSMKTQYVNLECKLTLEYLIAEHARLTILNLSSTPQRSRDLSWREKSSQLPLLNIKGFALPEDQNEPKTKIF